MIWLGAVLCEQELKPDAMKEDICLRAFVLDGYSVKINKKIGEYGWN